MNKKEFLKQSDKNILSFEVGEVMFEGKGNENAVFFNVGLSKKEEEKHLESLTIEQIENPTITFQQFEVMLTKSDLEFMLDQINKADS